MRRRFRRSVLRVATVLLISLLAIPGAFAADAKGQFALRGAGLITCAIYEKEREAKSEAYLMTAGWIDGYISGINQSLAETYEILPFETTELITAIVAKHCAKNPSDRIFSVVKSLFAKLHQDRLSVFSNKTNVAVGERKTTMYVEVLRRAQKRLNRLGFYTGKITGSYEQSTIDAMKAFQRSIDFKPTGFPDQMTLWRLFRTSG